jgi:hypothetical protein
MQILNIESHIISIGNPEISSNIGAEINNININNNENININVHDAGNFPENENNDKKNQ